MSAQCKHWLFQALEQMTIAVVFLWEDGFFESQMQKQLVLTLSHWQQFIASILAKMFFFL